VLPGQQCYLKDPAKAADLLHLNDRAGPVEQQNLQFAKRDDLVQPTGADQHLVKLVRQPAPRPAADSIARAHQRQQKLYRRCVCRRFGDQLHLGAAQPGGEPTQPQHTQPALCHHEHQDYHEYKTERRVGRFVYLMNRL